MTKYHYNGKMINLKNRITDQLVTPNHRVLRRIHNYKKGISESKYVFEEADQLKTKIPLIPIGAKFMGEKMDKNIVKLLSWIVSEGSLCEKERIVIYQSHEKNPENCNEIREILNDLDMPFDEKLRRSGFTGKMSCMRFRLNRPISNQIYENYFPGYKKQIPDTMRNLSTNLGKDFIDTYMKADGNIEDRKLFTKSKEDADLLQEIIVKAGWGTTLRKDKNGIYVVRVIMHDFTQISEIEEVDYNGTVWCPTTDNGTVVVRRKGKVFISGNSQYPFSNLTFDWVVPEDMKKEKAIVAGKEQDFTYGDCQKEMDMVNRAFLEVMTEGDANGSVFTFPIPTYNITKDFDWDSENAKLLFELTAKYGLPYFQNYVGSGLDPKSIHAMCCRLNLDQNELMKRPGSMWGPGDSTGSVGVVTINLNRIAYEARRDFEGDKDVINKAKKLYLKKLHNYMVLCKDSLETKREVIERNMENGLMPFTKRYLGTFKNHFSTIGLCGMNEACLNLLGVDISTPEGKAFAIETLKFMSEKCKEFQQETGNLYNLEATPAESTAYRLAKEDKKLYGKKIMTSGDKVPFLTNSTYLPVDKTDDVVFALKHQNDIQPLYTGGTMFHTFLGEKMISGDAAKMLVKKIAENTRLPYFSITPTFSVCRDHGYLKGEQFKCPTCQKDCEVYTRIVGYFRSVQQWNEGKKEEYSKRVAYLEKKAMENPIKITTSKLPK
ncbi:MAG: ribonucleoside triphosphate reductase [Candidatus Aenigmarchaeota archaeon]|nr:ribonucleoside triphosphate reductase [Candidatus Aenigmarchaeota archaeon]